MNRRSLVWIAVSLATALACGSDHDPLDTISSGPVSQSGSPSGDPPDPGGQSSASTSEGATEGSTTDTPTTDTPTTEGETGGSDRAICDRYLECLAATQPEALPAAQMGFGPNAPCWSATPAEIEQCLAACHTGLGATHELFPDEPKCVQCMEDDECADHERCADGGCAAPVCGDNYVDDNEVCDDDQDVNCSDCEHLVSQCNPFSHSGCAAGELCAYNAYFGTSCEPGDLEGPGDGAVCDFFSGADFCGFDLTCVPSDDIQGCPSDLGCCTRLCHLQRPDDCPNGRVCEPSPLSPITTSVSAHCTDDARRSVFPSAFGAPRRWGPSRE